MRLPAKRLPEFRETLSNGTQECLTVCRARLVMEIRVQWADQHGCMRPGDRECRQRSCRTCIGVSVDTKSSEAQSPVGLDEARIHCNRIGCGTVEREPERKLVPKEALGGDVRHSQCGLMLSRECRHASVAFVHDGDVETVQ